MDNKVFLGRRRDRAIATLLSFKERECDHFLPDDVANRLRKEILDQINDVVDLAFDLMDDKSVIFNDEFFNKLDDIYEMVSEMSENGDT